MNTPRRSYTSTNPVSLSREKRGQFDCFRLMLVLLIVAFAVQPELASAAAVGATPGSFRVSESGAAIYTIPIAVPPGTAGMAPTLSLTYSSQGGNGILGIGWSLSGLSSIYRCPASIAQDGFKSGINFNANDRFCLDGQRLVAGSGVYGANGAEYRTETESYSRIISYGAAGNGPAYFKVWTKAGQIAEYGNTTDSRIEAQGRADVQLWGVNKTSDTKGNYLSVSYTEDNPNGRSYVSRIDYTGNAAAGRVPYASVQLSYEIRPDIESGYETGSLIKSSHRVTNIKTFNGSALVKEYRFTYEQGITGQRSRISEIKECAGDGICLPETKLTWSNLTVDNRGWQGFGPLTGPGSIALTRCKPLSAADVNGDGKTDLICAYDYGNANTETFVQLSQGNKFAGWQSWSAATGPGKFTLTSCNSLSVADVNGDGRTDLICPYDYGNANTETFVQLNQGGKFSGWQSWSPPTGTGSIDLTLCTPLSTADVNGDGETDLICPYDYGDANTETFVQTFTGGFPDHLITISSGLGSVTTITYKPITDPSVYTRDTNAAYPYLDFQGPIYVVAKTLASNGIGGNYATNYSYAGAKLHMTGGGFLGFRKVNVTDAQTGIVTSSTYRQDYPNQGLPTSVEKRTTSGQLLNQVQNTWQNTSLGTGVYHRSDLIQTLEQSWDLNGAPMPRTKTTTQYDAYANPTRITVATDDGYTTGPVKPYGNVKLTQNTYSNNPTTWMLGRLTRATVTSTLPSGASATRTSAFAYEPSSGLVVQEVIEPDQPNLKLVTSYTLDVFGNRTVSTISGIDIATRSNATTFDSQGRFPITARNALGHSETRAFDPAFGNPLSLKGPNGLTTPGFTMALAAKRKKTALTVPGVPLLMPGATRRARRTPSIALPPRPVANPKALRISTA